MLHASTQRGHGLQDLCSTPAWTRMDFLGLYTNGRDNFILVSKLHGCSMDKGNSMELVRHLIFHLFSTEFVYWDEVNILNYILIKMSVDTLWIPLKHFFRFSFTFNNGIKPVFWSATRNDVDGCADAHGRCVIPLEEMHADLMRTARRRLLADVKRDRRAASIRFVHGRAWLIRTGRAAKLLRCRACQK